MDIHHADGTYCFGTSTRLDKQDLGVLSGSGSLDIDIEAMPLLAGCYMASIGIHGSQAHDLHQFAYPFSVVSDRRDLGLVSLSHIWRHHPDGVRQAAPDPHARQRHATRNALKTHEVTVS